MRTGLRIGLLAVALIAPPLAAQQHKHSDAMPGAGKPPMGMSDCSMMGSMMSMMEQGGGMEMMTMMRYVPSNVLKNKTLLKLTPDQLSRIEAMTGGAMGTPGMQGMGTTDNPMMKQMQERQSQLHTAFDNSPADSAAIASAVMSMAEMHSSMMTKHIIAAARVRDMLTPAQREQLGKRPSPCMNGNSGMTMKGRKPAPMH
jgi:Spy/CpxP family protein refolding chaperone